MICSKCKISKPKSKFAHDKSAKRGHRSWCKDCDKLYRQRTKKRRALYHKAYYLQNKVRIDARQIEYDLNNPEQKREYYQKNKGRVKERYQKNRSHIKRYRKEHYLKNRAKILAYGKRRYQETKEHKNEYCRQWRKRNKKLQVALNRKYEAAKLQRFPKWLTKAQLQQIKDFYINCPPGYEVDHIYPLQGRYVSGLHHPDNLQYLTKSANNKKYNNCPEIDDLWIEEMLNAEKKICKGKIY